MWWDRGPGDRSGSSAHQLQPGALLVLIEAAGLCQPTKFVAGVDALEAAQFGGHFKLKIVCTKTILAPPSVARRRSLWPSGQLDRPLETAWELDLVTGAAVLGAHRYRNVAPELNGEPSSHVVHQRSFGRRRRGQRVWRQERCESTERQTSDFSV